ncbi:Cullin binding-domain-containing protein [Dichomitus squalens]|uniref:Defective in cullin neddylation protein n=1 Tax=Dichomitus squalens TaxID=114155 RepID=A0A4Q9MTS7_9APHY|nr:Cullin binding-domain-containing protein [Dichomitus squalens]
MSSKARAKESKEMDALTAQFSAVTGASSKDARRYLTKFRRLDQALDAYYNDPHAGKPVASTSKLNALFDKYKDDDGDDITVDGTIKLCEDLAVNPEDVVLLAVAYELKSPAMGQWQRKGWTDGWKQLGVDTIDGFKTTLATLRQQLATDTGYFRNVYNYTFEFSRPPGQRSLGLDMAQGFWALLIPHGLAGGALSHITAVPPGQDEDGDEIMDGTAGRSAVAGAADEEGWGEKHTQWWFEFLESSGVKGVSKDVWQMFLEFVRTIDAKFEKYDVEGSWPSTIDDFVEYAKERIARGE